MITTDDIMALVRCRDPGHLQQRLEEAVADIAAERDAKAKQIRTLIRELDIACKRSLKAEAERDALLAEVMLWSHRAGEDAAQHRKTIEERDALRAALLEVLEFQSDPKAPTIHDFGRWRRLAQPSKAGEQK